MATITVNERFCGPPGTANGGYISGLLASQASQLVAVRLQRPVPLSVPLTVQPGEDSGLALIHGDQLIATAKPATLQLEVPRAPDYLGALECSRRFVGLHQHAFPRCFVCGNERARGDGLRIYAGATEDGRLVAAPWMPDASLALPDGKVRAEFMWAALDCPGYFAARSDRVPMLLGEFTAHLDRLVHVEEPCVVVGWRIAQEGRKHTVGTALFDEDGELCGRARAVWLEPKPQ